MAIEKATFHDNKDDNVSTCSMFKNKLSFIIWNSHKGLIFYDWIMRDDRMMRKMARKVVMMMTKTTTKCYCIGYLGMIILVGEKPQDWLVGGY